MIKSYLPDTPSTQSTDIAIITNGTRGDKIFPRINVCHSIFMATFQICL